MPRIDFEATGGYREERFDAAEAFRGDSAKAVVARFEPGQYIPVHAPDSDVVVDVRAGRGTVREGETAHAVGPGDAVAIEAGTRRGIRAAADERLEALLVTAPPPTDAEHEPVRRGLAADEFEPTLEEESDR
ncbi:cupin domain-containing protein [Halobellus rubicundus]|uniref:Cupin domain-containing protein n=1 Tax=Halobellus rubicundus TaxID=2996466 RepID=A0ABD5MFV2_9EURY